MPPKESKTLGSRHCANNKCDNMANAKCTACKRLWYCSRACQVAHWPTHKRLCKLWKAELSAAAEPTGSTPKAHADSPEMGGPNMILYPESPLATDNLPRGGSVRGQIGHNSMFEVFQRILQTRIQDMWTEQAAEHSVLFGEHTAELLAMLDIMIGANSSDAYHVKHKSKGTFQAQMVELEQRVYASEGNSLPGTNETFLFVPLDPYYVGVSHELTESLLLRHGLPSDFVAKVMRGYTGAKISIHLHGPPPASGSRPPDKDLIGPLPFACGLRMQCPMTPILAVLHIHLLLGVAKQFSASSMYILPHGLVIAASSDSNDALGKISKNLGRCFPLEKWELNNWQTIGRGTGNPVSVDLRAEGAAERIPDDDAKSFVNRIRCEGCRLYPFFSDDSSDFIIVQST